MNPQFRRGEVTSPDPDFIEDSRDAERGGKPNPYKCASRCESRPTGFLSGGRNPSANELMNFPQEHCSVPTSAGKDIPIRTERYTRDPTRRGDRLLQFPRLGIPQPHRPVPAPTGKGRTVRAKGYAWDSAAMPGEYALDLTCLDIP